MNLPDIVIEFIMTDMFTVTPINKVDIRNDIYTSIDSTHQAIRLFTDFMQRIQQTKSNKFKEMIVLKSSFSIYKNQ